jgi:hypothetical protein
MEQSGVSHVVAASQSDAGRATFAGHFHFDFNGATFTNQTL